MPIYEYRCTRCGHQFEVTHAVGDSVERCERCQAPVRRVFSPVGIIFKGAGFHVNDYRKTPGPASDRTAGSAGGSSEKDASARAAGQESGKTASAESDGKAAGGGKATSKRSSEGSGGDRPAAASGTGAGTKSS